MKKKFTTIAFPKGFGIISFAIFAMVLIFDSCGGANKNESAEEDQLIFNASQPVESGLYNVDFYCVKDTSGNELRSHFDGRLFVCLDPERSVLYVFENGNRTKADYLIELQQPFAKNDTVYTSVDMKNRPVNIVSRDSIMVLNFEWANDTVYVDFSPKARYTGKASDILGKIKEQKEKKK